MCVNVDLRANFNWSKKLKMTNELSYSEVLTSGPSCFVLGGFQIVDHQKDPCQKMYFELTCDYDRPELSSPKKKHDANKNWSWEVLPLKHLVSNAPSEDYPQSTTDNGKKSSLPILPVVTNVYLCFLHLILELKLAMALPQLSSGSVDEGSYPTKRVYMQRIFSSYGIRRYFGLFDIANTPQLLSIIVFSYSPCRSVKFTTPWVIADFWPSSWFCQCL